MKKLMFSLCSIVACFAVSSCLKNGSSNNTNSCTVTTITTAAPDSEVVRLKTFLDSSGISAIKDNRGFYYTMDTTIADSAHATNCSYIAFTYKGTFLNGTVFDSSNQVITYPLANFLVGWQEAIPLMRKNASMTLYLPPSLAYGAAGKAPAIPGNSYLIFYIKLYDFGTL